MANILSDIKKAVGEAVHEPVSSDFAPDPRRHKACLPGKHVHSAKIDDEKVKCFYRGLCQCLPPPDAFTRTYVDVYTNAVALNTPFVCCCCCAADNTRIVYFDQSPFAKPPVKANICMPIPCPCPHCFNLCGDVVAFQGPTVGCPAPCFGHAFGACCYCFFPTNCVCGLKEGEADKLVAVVTAELEKYKTRGGSYDRMI